MKCPKETQLQAFVDGEPGSDKIERHLAQCTACRDQVEALQAFKKTVATAVHDETSPEDVNLFVDSLPAHKRIAPLLQWQRWLPVAAAAGLTFAAGISIGGNTSPEPELVFVATEYGASIPENTAIDALTALQTLDASDTVTNSEHLRTLESWLCERLRRYGAGSKAASMQAINDAEDALDKHDYQTAVSLYSQAVSVAGSTDLAEYMRLRYGRALMTRFGDPLEGCKVLAPLFYEGQTADVRREAAYLLINCYETLGDTWNAADVVERLARDGDVTPRLAAAARSVGDQCYEDTRDVETAHACYAIWAESAGDVESRLRRMKETRTRLALLDETADDDWEPLILFLRTEDAYPRKAQSLCAEILREYPESSLAEQAFIKWHGVEESRAFLRETDDGEPRRRPSPVARWRQVADSEAPEEIRAYALLKLADDLHAVMDGVEEVEVAYNQVAQEFPWTETGSLARDRAEEVRTSIERKRADLFSWKG